MLNSIRLKIEVSESTSSQAEDWYFFFHKIWFIIFVTMLIYLKTLSVALELVAYVLRTALTS